MNAVARMLGILTGGVALVAGAQNEPQTAEARARELQSRYMTAVKAELTSKLDAKNAVAGQVIALKTDADVTLANGTELPAGTKLVGQVVAAQAKTDEQAGSLLTVTIDLAQLKDGRTIPVRSLIRTMGTASGAAVDPMARPPAADGSLTGQGMGGVTNTRSGNGGGVGGLGGNGGIPSGRGGRQPNPMGTPGNGTPVDAAAPVDQRPVDAGETVTNRPRPTGVPGVMLSTSPTDAVSGTLTEYGRNIHLDSGLPITLGMITR